MDGGMVALVDGQVVIINCCGDDDVSGNNAVQSVDITVDAGEVITIRSFNLIPAGQGVNFDLVRTGSSFGTDSDGDGINNELDLDSDNDTCSDYVEGGGTFTTADGMTAMGTLADGNSGMVTQNLGNTVDSDGIPTSASGGQAKGISQDDTLENCTDSDGDDVADIDDLDDDNDGILDENEVVITPVSVPISNFEIEKYEIASANDFEIIPLDASSLVLTADFADSNSDGDIEQGWTANNFQAATGVSNVVFQNAYTSEPNNNAVDFKYTIDEADGLLQQYTITFEGNVDGGMAAFVNNTLLITNCCGDDDISGLNAVQTSVFTANPNDVITIRNFNLTPAGQSVNFDLVRTGTSTGTDIDMDGVVNRLDLDSDNDGCADYIEGGATFDSSNGVTAMGVLSDGNGNFITENLGNTVDANGVPTIATAGGQALGTSQNDAAQDANCDPCEAGASAPPLSVASGTTTMPATPVGGDVFVKETATGSGTGADWDNALGAADLEAAVEAGGSVYVAAGTYTPAGTINLGTGSGTVAVYGGFPANATGTDISGYDPEANVTTISGDGLRGIFLGIGATAADNVTVQGFVLDNGLGTGSAIYYAAKPNAVNAKFLDLICQNHTVGSGTILLSALTNANTNILVQNCTFTGNNKADGGGIYITSVYPGSNSNSVTNTGQYLIEGCSFSNNTVSVGGALYITSSHAWTINNSTFCGNTANAADGGAVYCTTCFQNEFNNSTFDGNTASLFGGAMYATTATVSFDNTNFVGNQGGSTANGGAIFATTATVEAINSSFYNNQAGGGGAIYSTTFYLGNRNRAENCIFSENQTTYAFAPTVALGSGGAVGIVADFNGWD
ncbi:MAG: hypothetical protein AAF599_08305, partial [Bacteroidota bacterium]